MSALHWFIFHIRMGDLGLKETDVRKYFKLSQFIYVFVSVYCLERWNALFWKTYDTLRPGLRAIKLFSLKDIEIVLEVRERWDSCNDRGNLGETEAVTMFTQGPGRWHKWVCVTEALYKHLLTLIRGTQYLLFMRDWYRLFSSPRRSGLTVSECPDTSRCWEKDTERGRREILNCVM